MRYCGRFAPSPTGLLHQGSLVTALASFLDARANAGQWLIRVEDLDGPRTQPGAEASILATLAALGLESDFPVIRQSTRGALYDQALHQLLDSGAAYPCHCSRSDSPGIYSGHCRDQRGRKPGAAYRLRLEPSRIVTVIDRLQGLLPYDNAALGDPVIFRRDGVAAYQLAVVIDDAAQGVTDVVRGADLLDSTAWQLQLAEALGLAPPRFAHVPLVVEPDGSKLAKSRHSLAVDTLVPARALTEALQLLNHAPPPDTTGAPLEQLLRWAVEHWDPQRLAGQRTVALS